jgi:hypothetical protein
MDTEGVSTVLLTALGSSEKSVHRIHCDTIEIMFAILSVDIDKNRIVILGHP